MFDYAERTPSGQIVVYERATGKRFPRWSVDAREMLSLFPDVYTLNPSECTVEAEAAPIVEPEPEHKLPTEHSPGVPLRAVTSASGPAQPLAAPQRTSRVPKQ